MRTIYRIENPETGIGVYQTPKKFEDNFANLGRKHTDNDHPSLWSDTGLPDYQAEKLFSGCKSLSQLKNWFGEDFDPILNDRRFAVARYDVPEEYVCDSYSGKQIFFRRVKGQSKTYLDSANKI